MATESEPVTASTSQLFDRRHLPLALGAVVLVTLAAFENRAVTTTLPTLVQEFDALGSFGVANAAPIASYVVSLAFAGLWADRSGPVPALRVGVLGFASGQLMVGMAVGMPMVVVGRLLSGLAEGLIDVGLMVLVARILPAELRPKMFSLFAAAWVLPSLFGPLLAGVVTEQVGWRWVFLGALGFLVPTWLLIQPAIRLAQRHPSPDETDGETSDPPPGTSGPVMSWALTAATAVFGLTLAGDQLEAHPEAAGLVIVVCLVATVASAVHLLPAGTFRLGRGMPTTVAMRGITSVAFMGTGAWLPLLLTLIHDFRPSTAGISLSITGVMWAAGSWLQGRDHGYSSATVLRAAMAAMTGGLIVTSLLAWTTLPPYVGLTGWAIAGVGMGLSSPTLSVLVLDGSDHTNQGRNTSAAHVAGSLSIATAFAVSGTAVAFSAPDPGRLVFGAIITGSIVVALLGTVVSPRVSLPHPSHSGPRPSQQYRSQ